MRLVRPFFILLFLCVCHPLLSQWKQMNGYQELPDSPGKVLGLAASSDGAQFHILSSKVVGTKTLFYLQQYETKSGLLLGSRLLNDSTFTTLEGAFLTSDGKYCILAGRPADAKDSSDAFVYTLEDFKIKEKFDLKTVIFYASSSVLSYSEVLRELYIGQYGYTGYSRHGWTYSSSTGGMYRASNLPTSTVSAKIFEGWNIHDFVLGKSSGRVYANTFYLNINTQSGSSAYDRVYALDSGGKTTVLYSVNESPSAKTASSYRFAFSSNERYAIEAHGLGYTFLRFSDSTSFPISSTGLSNTCGTFTNDNHYAVVVNGVNSVLTFEVGHQRVCGATKLPFSVDSYARIVQPEGDSLFILGDEYGMVRRINLVTDTIAASYDLLASDSIQYVDSLCTFEASVEFPDESSVSWDFGDGTQAVGLKTSHAYKAPGAYTVRGTVVDSTGSHQVVCRHTIHVIEYPTIAFQATPIYGLAPLSVTFTNLSHGSIIRWRWFFDDGDSSDLENPTHVFLSKRPYTIRLVGFDGKREHESIRWAYINADAFKSILLNGSLVQLTTDGRPMSQNGSTPSVRNGLTKFLRTSSNTLNQFVVNSSYYNYYSNGSYHSACTGSYTLYRIGGDGRTQGSFYRSSMDAGASDVGLSFPGSIWPYRDSSLLVFRREFYLGSPTTMSIVKPGMTPIEIKLPYNSSSFTVNCLNHSLDAYSFYRVADSTDVVIYSDTSKLFARQTVRGYALPAVELASGTRYMVVASSPAKDTLAERNMDLYYTSTTNSNFTTKRFPLTEFERYNKVVALGSNRFLIAGHEATATKVDLNYKYTTVGLLKTIDENGTVLSRLTVPQWQTFTDIHFLNDTTVALNGTPAEGLPGFVVYNTNGFVSADCRFQTNGETYTAFGITKSPSLVLYATQRDYNAAVYMVNIDINQVVDDVQLNPDENSSSASILVYPNPGGRSVNLRVLDSPSDLLHYEVLSSLGQTLQKGELILNQHHARISIDETVPMGMVFIRVRAASWSRTAKFILDLD